MATSNRATIRSGHPGLQRADVFGLQVAGAARTVSAEAVSRLSLLYGPGMTCAVAYKMIRGLEEALEYRYSVSFLQIELAAPVAVIERRLGRWIDQHVSLAPGADRVQLGVHFDVLDVAASPGGVLVDDIVAVLPAQQRRAVRVVLLACDRLHQWGLQLDPVLSVLGVRQPDASDLSFPDEPRIEHDVFAAVAFERILVDPGVSGVACADVRRADAHPRCSKRIPSRLVHSSVRPFFRCPHM